jgi:hypothetical protein
MSNALFLPRELFSNGPAPSAASEPPRTGTHFASGEAVAADLLGFLADTPQAPAAPVARTERRRRPRAAHARGVDIYLA